MARALLLTAALLAITFAGCIEDQADAEARARASAKRLLPTALTLAPGPEPLWYDPQTFPHPAFNFPTISNPPADYSASPWLKPIPVADIPKPVQGLQHVAQVQGAPRGAGMSLIGSLAILPSSPTHIIDISDPTAPKKVGEYRSSSRGSDTIVYPDGRIITVLATGSPALPVVDITDPTQPVELAKIQTRGTHKVDVVPGTPIVYNSARGEIYDLSDPTQPVDTGNRMPATCHRTYFYIEPSREFYRAYCAGYEYTHIWDIKEPSKPVVVASIPMWHANQQLPPSSAAPATFSHFSIASHDAKILVVGDEMGGGAAAACTAHVSTPARDVSAPTGALWFYDISNEKNAVLKGWLSPRAHFIDNQGALSCTAHHGRLVPDPEGKRHLLAMAFYGQGVQLVDFTDPSSPRILDAFRERTSTWEAWYYNGYVFTGDGGRGLDVIKLR